MTVPRLTKLRPVVLGGGAMVFGIGAAVLAAPIGVGAAPAAACCSFRLDSVPPTFVAGGAPGEFSASMVNESDDRTVGSALLVITIRLASLLPERVRVERQAADDGQWVTLPADLAAPGLVTARDTAYAGTPVAPGAVAGGRYRLTFSATSAIGNATLGLEAYPFDNGVRGALLGRSSGSPFAVSPPGPADLASNVVPYSAAPENGIGGIGGASGAGGAGGATASSDATRAHPLATPAPGASASQLAARVAPASRTSVLSGGPATWVVTTLGGVLLVLLIGVVIRVARR